MTKADDMTLSETWRKQAVLAGNSETPAQGEHGPFLQQVGAREALAAMPRKRHRDVHCSNNEHITTE